MSFFNAKGVHGEHQKGRAMKRKICFILGILAAIGMIAPVVFADSVSDLGTEGEYNWDHTVYTQTVEFTCVGEVEDYTFPAELEMENRVYELVKSSDVVVSSVEEPELEREIKTVTFTNVTGEEVESIQEYLDESGVRYELSEMDTVALEQSEEVSSYLTTGYVYKTPELNEIPATDTIEYESPITRETTTQTLPYQNMELVSPYTWQDGFSLNLTFEIMDAEYFLLDDLPVYLDKEKPVLTEEAKQKIISASGLPANSFTIDSIEWSSDIYEMEGTTYRDAVTHGRQLLGVYRINYGNEEAQTGKLYDVTASYEISDADYETQRKEATIYHCHATATYQVKAPSLFLILLLAVLIIAAGLLVALTYHFIASHLEKKKKSQATYHVTESDSLVNTTRDDFIERK